MKRQKMFGNYLKNRMKTLIIEENNKIHSSERNNEKNINGTNKKVEPLLTGFKNEAAQLAMTKRKNYFFKRLSPFLLLAAFLIVLFFYKVITDTGNIES